MKESNNQLDGNQLTEDIDTTEEINMDPSLELVKAPKGMKEAVMRKIYEHEHPEIFDGLSEEDRKALWLGREMLAKEGERKKAPDIQPDKVKPRRTRKTRRFTAKVYGLVAVVAVAMVAVGITSVGGPQHLAQMVDEMFEGRSQVKVNVGSETTEFLEESDREEKSYQTVKDELGIDPVRMSYKPEGMSFIEMSLDDSIQTAVFMYSYEENILSYTIFLGYNDSVMGINQEDKVVKKSELEVNGINISLKEFKVEGKTDQNFIAQFLYQGNQYLLSGSMNEDEFSKIIKNLKFL